jgi:hypothetical protein
MKSHHSPVSSFRGDGVLQSQPLVSAGPVRWRRLEHHRLAHNSPPGAQTPHCAKYAKHRIRLRRAGVGIQVTIFEDSDWQMVTRTESHDAAGNLLVRSDLQRVAGGERCPVQRSQNRLRIRRAYLTHEPAQTEARTQRGRENGIAPRLRRSPAQPGRRRLHPCAATILRTDARRG